MTTSHKITGMDAIRLAQRDNLTIRCHANAIDDGGIVTLGVARQISREDANLIYVTVEPSGWVDADGRSLSTMDGYDVSDYFSPAGMYLGPDDAGIEPRWNDEVAGE